MGFELRALVVGSGFGPLKAEPVDLQSRLCSLCAPLHASECKTLRVCSAYIYLVIPKGVSKVLALLPFFPTPKRCDRPRFSFVSPLNWGEKGHRCKGG